MPPLTLPFRCGKATVTLNFLPPPRPQAVAFVRGRFNCDAPARWLRHRYYYCRAIALALP